MKTQNNTNQVNVTSSVNSMFPAPISEDRINWLIEKGIDADIAQINLEMVKMKLRDQNEGQAWTERQSDEAELEYKRWLTLVKRHGKGMIPTKAIDIIWHQHILDTRAYITDCDKVFGGYMHHYPYFGMRDEQEAKDLENAFRKTQALYQDAFKETLGSNAGENCWHDCAGRCWHDCSN
ncbi:MAG: glycine-rich domain-containing protein-like [Bacteroidota bacterium]